MNKTRTVSVYLFFDIVAACTAWVMFYAYREQFSSESFLYWIGQLHFSRFGIQTFLLLPVFWVAIYYISGYYTNIFRKARLIELWQTFFTSLFGVIILFFAVLLDEPKQISESYLRLFSGLFGFHFGLTYLFRLFHTSYITRQIHQRKIGFNTLLIGGDSLALQYYQEWENQRRTSGNLILGFIRLPNENSKLDAYTRCLGNLDDIPKVIEQYGILEVFVSLNSSEHELLAKILIKLNRYNVTVWGIPDLYDILSGNPKGNNLYGRPLFKISNGIMPVWAANLKRILDVVISAAAMTLLLPVSLFIITAIKMGSRGPAIYAQERIGRYGKPFKIYKFRSMKSDAEQNGPELSRTDDPRITRFGRFLRKSHLDEIPQFWNVIVGQMSLVGPRPERQYYIEQLVERAPQYTVLHKVRPGITSWGQVKYGYASNLEQMLERLPYDLVYLKNPSLYLDFKIMIYSVLEIFHGKGK